MFEGAIWQFVAVHETPQLAKSNYCIAIRMCNTDLLEDYVKKKVPTDSEFNITLVDESFVLNQLQNLNVNKATGIDNISAKYLKMAAQAITKPLTKVLNLSIESNTFPDNLKKAKVTPIYKLEDHWSCSSPERLSHCKLMRFKLIENRPMKVYAWTLLTPGAWPNLTQGHDWHNL